MLRWLQRYFLTGLLAVTPLVFTLWVLVELYQLIDASLRPWLQRLPHMEALFPDTVLTIFAFFSFVLIIVLIGLATRSLVGVAFFNLVERVMKRIPVVKTIFVGTQQIAEVFLSNKRSAFQEVVLFEYPRFGCFSIGFVTRNEPDSEMLNVFLPTTPNPTSGFMLLVPRTAAEILPFGVEEGIRLIISGGSVMTVEQAGALQEAGARLRAARQPAEDSP